jgi:hypothetical protein
MEIPAIASVVASSCTRDVRPKLARGRCPSDALKAAGRPCKVACMCTCYKPRHHVSYHGVNQCTPFFLQTL